MGLADKFVTTYKQKISELVLVPSDGGRFEVSIDGDLVYSKLKAGRFPEWEEIRDTVPK